MIAKQLIEFTKINRPDIYNAILTRIRPHSLNSVLKILDCHLLRVPDLNIFNENTDAVPEFIWSLVKYLKYPTPGDAHGIYRTCRVTKSDTQETLDSKHLSSSLDFTSQFNVENDILHELAQFSIQKHVFEFSNRRRYATVYVLYSIEKLMKLLPNVGHLIRGDQQDKGRDSEGKLKYLSTFKYIVVEDRGTVKILYQSLRDLTALLSRLSPQNIVAFSDVRCVFHKCGVINHFFNMIQLVEKQLFVNDDSIYEKDVIFMIKYQCIYNLLYPLTRSGLAKCPNKSPLEILSFEAPKQNFSRLSTRPSRKQWYDVTTSADKIFFGQQFNEGVGYTFALMPK